MPQRLRYAELAPEGTAALRQLEHYLNTGTALGSTLLDLVRLRASVLNGCDFCIHMHTSELLKSHEPHSRIDGVSDWQSSDAFTPRERAALAWTDSVTNIQETHVPDEDFVAVNEFFTGKDLADLTLAISSINAWNRLGIAFRAEWNPRAGKAAVPAEQPAIDGDGGKVAEE